MARNGDQEAIGFTYAGGARIAAVAARVCPPEWVFDITQRFDNPGSAIVRLFRPDRSEFTENVYHSDYVALRIPSTVWWENTLRDIVQSASPG